MANGIRIRRPNGEIALDITTKMTFILGRYTIPHKNAGRTGSFTIPDTGMSRYFAYVDGIASVGNTGYKYYYASTPSIEVSGRTVKWTYSDNSNDNNPPQVVITYGGIT